MTFFEAVQFVTLLIALPMSASLMIAVLLQPSRDRLSWLFAVLGAGVTLWVFSNLLNFIKEPSEPGRTVELYLQIFGLGLTANAFFIFSSSLNTERAKEARVFISLALFSLFISPPFIFSGYLAQHNAQDQIELEPLGWFYMGLTLVFYFGGNYFLWTNPDPRSKHLRLPGFLMLASFAVNGVPILLNSPLDMVLSTVAIFMIGYQVMRFQVFDPLQNMYEQQVTTNEALNNAYQLVEEEKRKLQQLSLELKQANEYKSAFLANMSHELRTPLNAVIGYSNLLEQGLYGELNGQQTDRLVKIGSNGKHLLSLINDVLDLSKIDSGQLEINPRHLEYKDLLNEFDTIVEPLLANKDLDYHMERPQGIHPVYADPIRMKQVLINLLSNAIKFTHDGHVKLSFRNFVVQNNVCHEVDLPAEAFFHDGHWVLVAVEDTGIGIAEADRNRVFAEFQQVDNSATREYGGTGLGLAISKRLVEMQEGIVWFRSTIGEGSTFYVALPAYGVSEHSIDEEAPTVLVIEDDADAAELIRLYLTDVGYNSILANNAKEGLTLAKEKRPDIITIDLVMPQISGWDILTQLKDDPLTQDIPVVIISAHDEKPHGTQLGVSDYLLKPIDEGKLRRSMLRVANQLTTSDVIWIVEDDPDQREIVKSTLSEYQTIDVPDGRAALGLLRGGQRPALMILDLMMPYASGFDVLRFIRNDENLVDIPVIIMTAKTLDAQELAYLNANTNRVITKQGLDSSNLHKQIEAVLETSLIQGNPE